MKILTMPVRVYRFLRRHLQAPWAKFPTVPDPRDPRGLRWPLHTVLHTVLAALMSGYHTLRDLEAHSPQLQLPGHPRLKRRLPDTTVYDLLPQLDPEALRQTLVQQVHSLWRKKCLTPVGLPCGVVAIDGKAVGTLDHDADGWGQKNHREHDGSPYWLVRVLRAVLTSAASKTALEQIPIPAQTNEMGSFATMFRQLMQDFGQGDLFEIVTTDAGMTSKENAALVHGAGKGYVTAVKGNQPELLREVQRLLQPLVAQAPLAQSPWETSKGYQVQRRLYRTVEIAAYPGWESVRQAWMVRAVRRWADGREEFEDRYFITNVTVGRLSPTQSLLVVRGHWGIENDSNWTLDQIYREDDKPMCTKGTATRALGVLRLLAYNLQQLARRRHLGPKPAPTRGSQELLPWRQVLQAFLRALSPQTELTQSVR